MKRKADEEENGPAMDDEATAEDIAQLVEYLSKEQLSGILMKAALAHADTLDEVRKFADEDSACRKLFVRGLSWTSSSDVLKRAFEKFGPVEEAVVINDKNTGKSKGFGFVTYKHRDGAIRALKEPSKKIEGRMTVCHLSGSAPSNASVSVLPSSVQLPTESVASRKVYVGNVPKSAQGGALLEFFSQFGEVEEGPLGFDRETGKCKGFALFIYKSSESARKCLNEPLKEFGGQQVQCKYADVGKGRDDNTSLTASVLGYDITNPASISSYTPSFLQANTQSLLQPGALSSYGLQSLDPLGVRGSSILGADSGYSSGLGLGTSQSHLLGARGSSSISSLQNYAAQGPGYSSLPRSFY